MYSDEIKRKFVNLKLNGFTYNKISNMLNVPRRTLLRWSIEFQNEINQMNSDSFRTFMNALKVTAKHRIKRLTSELENVESSLKYLRGDYYHYLKYAKLKISLISALKQFDNLLIPDIDNAEKSE